MNNLQETPLGIKEHRLRSTGNVDSAGRVDVRFLADLIKDSELGGSAQGQKLLYKVIFKVFGQFNAVMVRNPREEISAETLQKHHSIMHMLMSCALDLQLKFPDDRQLAAEVDYLKDLINRWEFSLSDERADDILSQLDGK